MTRIDESFQGSDRALHPVCRVKDFWEKKTKTFCFSVEIKFPWRFDYRLRARVIVFPSPASLHPSRAQYALSEPESGVSERVYFAIDAEKLVIRVPLSNSDGMVNEDLPWRMTQTNKLCIVWERHVRLYRIDLLAVLDPPPSGPPPIELGWSRRFFAGGLPSLGKRR